MPNPIVKGKEEDDTKKVKTFVCMKICVNDKTA